MKSYLILIVGVIFIVLGAVALTFAFPSIIEGNLTLMYVGFGLIILGALIDASWFVGKLKGRW